MSPRAGLAGCFSAKTLNVPFAACPSSSSVVVLRSNFDCFSLGLPLVGLHGRRRARRSRPARSCVPVRVSPVVSVTSAVMV